LSVFNNRLFLQIVQK